VARVEHRPPQSSGLVTHFLKRDEKKNFTKAFVSEVKDGIRAQLKYEVIHSGKHFSLLRIELLTGRKHQIRAQLSAIGCPIVGDVKYGASKPNADQGICLHAAELSFIHPVKKEPLTLVAGLPVWGDRI
jgi:23S rRNA pseudouridine1911/1915/1917 synthase